MSLYYARVRPRLDLRQWDYRLMFPVPDANSTTHTTKSEPDENVDEHHTDCDI